MTSPTKNETAAVVISKDVGRNDPCPCNSGKKYKKCCGFNTPVVSAAPAGPSTPEEKLEEARRNFDAQLAKYAPTVTVDQVEARIREALPKQESAMQVIQSVFNDDNLSLSNKRHADRLFRALMSLWNTIVENEKNQTNGNP